MQNRFVGVSLDLNGGRKRVNVGTDQRGFLTSKSPSLEINENVNNRQHTLLENLAPFSNYSIMITAETEEGEGPFSPPLYCSTQLLSKYQQFSNPDHILRYINHSGLT